MDLDESVAALARREAGAIRRDQVRNLGATKGALRHRLARGSHSVTSKVLRIRGTPATEEHRAWSARTRRRLHCGPLPPLSGRVVGSRVSSSSRSTWPDQGVSLAVRLGWRSRTRQRCFPPATSPRCGASRSSRPRCSCSSWPPWSIPRSWCGRSTPRGHAVWSAGHPSARFSTTSGRGKEGTAALRGVMAERPQDYRPPDSNQEARFQDLVRRVGIRMRRQIDVGGDEWLGRMDFIHERLPLIVQIDSELHHTALIDAEADERQLSSSRPPASSSAASATSSSGTEPMR